MDVEKIREDFPILKVKMHGKRLVYLDSAATSQKPKQVVEKIREYYYKYNANIHRGLYEISERATEEYTESKRKVSRFINASGIEEIIYVRNTTEGINLVSLGWAEQNLKKGDGILITEMEHHSNIVPWQLLSKKKGLKLDYAGLDNTKTVLDMEDLKGKLEKGPKLVAITHASNVLGTINDVKTITKLAHRAGARVLVDGAQSVPHMKVDVADIDCDFFAFSGHKMLGPAGIGVLYTKRRILEETEPVIGGGDMIKSVNFKSSTWNDLPWKFEAGTSNIEGGIGLGAAVDYLDAIGIDKVRKHEKEITGYALEELSKMGNVIAYGPKDVNERGGVVSFSIKGVHPHDIATVFDSEGVAIRAGHHCAMPLVRGVLDEPALARMSFYIYNDEKDVDSAVAAIKKVNKIFKVH